MLKFFSTCHPQSILTVETFIRLLHVVNGFFLICSNVGMYHGSPKLYVRTMHRSSMPTFYVDIHGQIYKSYNMAILFFEQFSYNLNKCFHLPGLMWFDIN